MDSGNQDNPIPKRQRFNDPESVTVSPIDYISDLPESIISSILSSIPTKYAVRSSLLSRSWRHRWNQITSFDFDYQWRPNCKSELKNAGVKKMSFVEFVNMVFLKTTAESIHSFRLRRVAPDLGSVTINKWLSAAMARNCRVLDLGFSFTGGLGDDEDFESDDTGEFYLPGSLYSCGTLEVLKLYGPFIIELSDLVCLPKLVVLELNSVLYERRESANSLSMFIAGCPVLQSLTIERKGFDCMVVCKVSSPTLKHLRIHCDDNFEGQEGEDVMKLELDAPELEYLYLHDVDTEFYSIQGLTLVNEMDIHIAPWKRVNDGAIVGLVRAFDHVKFLKLSVKAMKALGRATENLSSTSFSKVTKLAVDIDSSQWSHLVDLIDRCVKLEVLEIRCGDDRSYWFRPIRVPRCLLSSLKHVTFKSFDGLEEEMSLLEVFLDQGLMLESVSLCSNGCEPVDYKRKFHILNKVSKLPRASTRCKISDCAWFEDLGAVEWVEW